MFGYVRPCKPELKVREYEDFHAMYCGLCKTLGRRYSLFWRFSLNYDFCFLAMVLTAAKEGSPCDFCRRRCFASPLRKHKEVAESPALDFSADASVILTCAKLADDVQDEHGGKRILYRLLQILTLPAYRKAQSRRPAFAKAVSEGLSKLSALEKEGSASMDRVADCFAGILRAGAAHLPEDRLRRPAAEILYQTGRWIYVLDAWDDLDGDLAEHRYNAAARRYRIEDVSQKPSVQADVRQTLEDSAAGAAMAMELLPGSCYAAVIRNVLYLGMPQVTEAVFAGHYRPDTHCTHDKDRPEKNSGERK